VNEYHYHIAMGVLFPEFFGAGDGEGGHAFFDATVVGHHLFKGSGGGYHFLFQP